MGLIAILIAIRRALNRAQKAAANLFRRALDLVHGFKSKAVEKAPVLTQDQKELYTGISHSGRFTLDSTKDAFAGVKRLRDTADI